MKNVESNTVRMSKEEIIEEISPNWVEQHFSTVQRDFFIDLLLKLKPSFCLETGFCTGTSSATILAAARPKKLISIGLAYNNLDVAKKLEEQYSFKLIKGDSTHLLTSEFFGKEFPDGVDFFHVDGGHAYHEALADLENALPHMNDRATFVVDDYHSKICPLPSVDQAVDFFVKEHSLEVQGINTEDGKGMAIISR